MKIQGTPVMMDTIPRSLSNRDFDYEMPPIPDRYLKMVDNMFILLPQLDSYWHEVLTRSELYGTIYIPDLVMAVDEMEARLKRRLTDNYQISKKKASITYMNLNEYEGINKNIPVRVCRFKKYMLPIAKKLKNWKRKADQAFANLDRDNQKRKYYYTKMTTNNFKQVKNFASNGISQLEKMKLEANNALLLLQEVHTFFSQSFDSSLRLSILFEDFNNSSAIRPSFRKFRAAINTLNIGYRCPKEIVDNSALAKKQRLVFLTDLLNLFDANEDYLLFFDVTTIRLQPKRIKQWNYKQYPTGRFYTKNLDCVHILMLISTTKIIALQIIRETMNSTIIFNFLRECLINLQRDSQDPQYHIVMDNDTKHKTHLMKTLCLAHKVHFHFIVPRNPYFNIIEYLFRFAKGSTSNEYSLSR